MAIWTNSTPSGTLTIATAPSANDVLIAGIVTDQTGNSLTTMPVGFSLVASQETTADNQTLFVCIKNAASGSETDLTFAVDSGTTASIGFVLSVSGRNNTTPQDVTAVVVNNNTPANPLNLDASIAPANNGCVIVQVSGGDVTSSANATFAFSTQSGATGSWTTQCDINSGFLNIGCGTATQTTAGSITARTAISGVSSGGASIVLALRASGGGGSAPIITGVSDTTPTHGQSLAVTGSNFGATQGTNTIVIGGVSQTATAWADDSITVTFDQGINLHGVPLSVVITTGAGQATDNSITGAVPVSGHSFVNLTSIESTVAWRLDSTPVDLAVGNQIEWDDPLVNVSSAGVPDGPESVTSFMARVGTTADGYGAWGTLTITQGHAVSLSNSQSSTQVSSVAVSQSGASAQYVTFANSQSAVQVSAVSATSSGPALAVEAMSDSVAQVEAQYRLSDSSNLPWKHWPAVPVSGGAVTIGPLQEGMDYDVRLRFIGDDGRVGRWVQHDRIRVTGKSNPPAQPTGLRYGFADTALTAATVTIDWDAAPEPDVVAHEVTRPGRTVRVSANTFTELAEWIGERTYDIVAIDEYGMRSPAARLVIGKQAPGVPQGFRADVIDNNVLLYWTAPAMTSLPIASYELRRGASWAAGDLIGRKTGGFTSVFEMVSGDKTYWLAAVDTDNNIGAPAQLTVTVAQPPDYVLKADYNSAFSGTLSNALLEYGRLILPVNTTETVAQHFTNNGWASPQAQISAGYPIYIQPVPNSAYYEETIDYGAALAATKVTVTPTVETLAGAPVIAVTISHKVNSGDAWTDVSGSQAYISSFRYIKVRVAVTAAGGDDLMRMSKLNIKLDAKLKTITGQVTCNAADSGGTTIYLTDNRQADGVPVFLDVESIQITAQGTTSVTAVYDFVDLPNPVSAKVLLFNSTTGARLSAPASYEVRGY